MEVLDSIWHFLTMENETLTKIITAPTVVIEAWLGFLLLSSILDFNYKPKQKITYITFISLLTLISEFIIPAPYNIIFNYFLIFVFVKLYLKLNIVKTILAVIIPTAVFAITNTLLLKPFLVLTNLSYSEAYNALLYRLLYLFILYPLILFITLILRNIKVTLHFVNDINKKNKRMILLNTLLGFFTLCIQLTITFFYIDFLHIGVTILSFISLLAYFFISF